MKFFKAVYVDDNGMPKSKVMNVKQLSKFIKAEKYDKLLIRLITVDDQLERNTL